MRNLKWRLQEDEYGCGFACLAMITNQSYVQVKEDLLEAYHQGLDDDTVFDYLADHGFFVAKRKRFTEYRGMLDNWTRPFASVHLVKVLCSHEAFTCHYVVMRDDGSVLDPTTTAHKTLKDYVRVLWVAGVTKPRKRNTKCRSMNIHAGSVKRAAK